MRQWVVIAALSAAPAVACTPTREPNIEAGAPISTVRVNVLNLGSDPVPFRFTFGVRAPLDTIAPGGTLRAPIIRQTYQVTPGTYRFELRDARSGTTLRDSLRMAQVREVDFATIELIFDEDSARITTCHCVRLYGESNQPPRR